MPANVLNSSMYWMMQGLPYMLNIPTIGGGKTSRWDGSRWLSSSNTITTSNIDNAVLGMNEFGGKEDRAREPGKVATGYSGAFDRSALSRAAANRAANSLVSSATGISKAAALNGTMGALVSGNVGTGLQTALSSAANPGNFVGTLGNLANSAFGLTGISPAAMSVASTLGTLVGGPGLGAAVSVLGGFGLDALGDAFNMRSMESIRDRAEDMAGDYVSGRLAGAVLSRDIGDAINNPSIANYAPAVASSLASIGAIPNESTVQNFAADTYASMGESPAISAALADASMQALSPSERAAMQSLGLSSAHNMINAAATSTATQSPGVSASVTSGQTSQTMPSSFSQDTTPSVSAEANLAAHTAQDSDTDSPSSADSTTSEGRTSDRHDSVGGMLSSGVGGKKSSTKNSGKSSGGRGSSSSDGGKNTGNSGHGDSKSGSKN